jgi:hypothetical protein
MLRVFDDSVIRDTMTETHNLHISILRADTSQISLYLVNVSTVKWWMQLVTFTKEPKVTMHIDIDL